jgi:hypothetical protein
LCVLISRLAGASTPGRALVDPIRAVLLIAFAVVFSVFAALFAPALFATDCFAVIT